MSLATADAAAPAFDWKRWPETEAVIDQWIERALEGNAFAANLAARMRDDTNTRFADWVDHLIVANTSGLPRRLHALGYVLQGHASALGGRGAQHQGRAGGRVDLAAVMRLEDLDVERVRAELAGGLLDEAHHQVEA